MSEILRTTIYIIFKEYTDASRGPSFPFINGEEFPLDDGTSVMHIVDECFNTLKFFQYEDANRFYDRENLNGLCYQFREMPKMYPNKMTLINSSLRRLGAVDWKSEIKPGNDEIIYERTDISVGMLGDYARRSEYDGHTVLLNIDALTTKKGHIKIQFNRESEDFDVVKDIKSLYDWLSKPESRSPQRIYCYNKKHGDAYHDSETYTDKNGRSRKAAQLLTTEEETNNLLIKAVGIDGKSDFWYWDKEHGKFIYFKNQKTKDPQSFHAYHLGPGEEDYDNICQEKLRIVQDI